MGPLACGVTGDWGKGTEGLTAPGAVEVDCWEETDWPGPGLGTNALAMGLKVNSLALGLSLDFDTTVEASSVSEGAGVTSLPSAGATLAP